MRTLAFIISIFCFSASAQTIIKAKSDERTYEIHRSTIDSAGTLKTKEKKFALVIGNKNYKVGPLQNSENDATDLSSLLQRKNFDVTKIINGTRLEMREAIRSFASKIAEGGVGLFYYSGHGVQVDGENFLVPVDADIEFKEEVADECIAVSTILRYMETTNNRLNIIILDACRNSPFKTFARSGEQGMLRVEAPTGSIVAYSTAPGSTASDGTGRNGLYTSKLIKYMDVPGLKLEEIFKQVRIDVSKESNNLQKPWESNSLMGDFYFDSN